LSDVTAQKKKLQISAQKPSGVSWFFDEKSNCVAAHRVAE
jgi:hypothetical protein